MRPLWTGSISFGLVNIPVGLYSATNSRQTIDLDLLRDSDHSRIRYKKVAEADGHEVPREHIVKGYEYEKGQYVVLTDDDFKRVQLPSNQTVDIKEFVNMSEIEPRFFNSPYFLAPIKGGAKAFALLKAVLEQTGLAGIAKVVIRPPREHLAMLKPLNGILVLETLHFVDELRDPAELQPPHTDIGKKELDMALALVQTMTDKWQPEKFHDEYRESLMKLIEQKVQSGSKALPEPKAKGKPAGQIIDLVSLLQESIGKTGKAPKKTARRKPQKLHKKAA